MRAGIGCAALAAILCVNPALAQVQAQAHSHVLSAFISGADPGVLAPDVVLGPRLRRQVGADADARKVYDALTGHSSGRDIQLRALSPGEAAGFSTVPGVRVGDPLFMLRADELVLALQYAPRQKSISYIEQLGPLSRPVAAPAPQPAGESKPTSVLQLPPPVTMSLHRPAPATASPAQPRPRGDCVVKPVMSDEELYNCGATPRQ